MPARLCLVVLDHRNDGFLGDLVASARAFCPEADVAWYDSGTESGDPPPELFRLGASRPLGYARVMPFFLDMLEWAAGGEYDYVVNLETDMAIVRPGFEAFVEASLRDADHLAPRLRRDTAPTSRWRPYRSLRAELPELAEMLCVDSIDGCFSPGQAFSRRYAQALVSSDMYGRLRDFVLSNESRGASYSLQEILMPTLAKALGLRTVEYPPEADRYNRYRPYHAAPSIGRALQTRGVHLVHPIRRDWDDPARRTVHRRLDSVAA
jgi:hypothetical protein